VEKFRTALLIACALVPLQAHADPIRITSGTVSVGSDAFGQLQGRNFTFRFEADMVEFPNHLRFLPLGCCDEPGRIGSFRDRGTLVFSRGPTINGREFDGARQEFAIESTDFSYT
jgi:hypothetical protein